MSVVEMRIEREHSLFNFWTIWIERYELCGGNGCYQNLVVRCDNMSTRRKRQVNQPEGYQIDFELRFK